MFPKPWKSEENFSTTSLCELRVVFSVMLITCTARLRAVITGSPSKLFLNPSMRKIRWIVDLSLYDSSALNCMAKNCQRCSTRAI